MSLMVLKNFRIVDEASDFRGSVIVENGIITAVCAKGGESSGLINVPVERDIEEAVLRADTVLNGEGLVLMPAFVDLHAHFRDVPEGFGQANGLPAETFESACLAAAAGGFGTVVCMANTRPPVDTIEQAAAIKARTDALGLVDVYPALSLTKEMEGKELSDITRLPAATGTPAGPVLLLSEDGKDMADGALFLAALKEARRAGLPVSCHCDLGGENEAVRRALDLAEQSGARVHIAHVSTAEAAEAIRRAKRRGLAVSCEVTPHHLTLTEADAATLGRDTFGKVSPPLRSEADRAALTAAIADGTIDAIATDHAPHRRADKERGAPGFSGLETAFAVCYGVLTQGVETPGVLTQGGQYPAELFPLSRLSSLMSASPARLLGLNDRGRIAPGLRGDLCIIDTAAEWTVNPGAFMSRGGNSPFAGRILQGTATSMSIQLLRNR